MIDFATQRNEICRAGKSLFERGYVHATAGNISMRVSDGFLITPTDACLGFLHAEQLAHADANGQRIGGPAPSKTLALHRAIYAADPGARCVLHTHSTELVALTLAGVWRPADILPPITPYFVMKVGHVPLIPYHRPGDAAVATLVSEAILASIERRVPIRGVMLERLGPTVWHDSPAAAMAVLEELEQTARLWRITEPRPAPLTEAQIEELRTAFGARW
jgi:ribulose-5-phosphate 4-epimerase/fuculose-1-phosphate aldolase